MATYYKIRNKKTGLFSRGGTPPMWTKTGKTWQSLGLLRQHLSLILDNKYHQKVDMTNWEIIPYEVIEQDPVRVDEVLSEKQLIKLLTK